MLLNINGQNYEVDRLAIGLEDIAQLAKDLGIRYGERLFTIKLLRLGEILAINIDHLEEPMKNDLVLVVSFDITDQNPNLENLLTNLSSAYYMTPSAKSYFHWFYPSKADVLSKFNQLPENFPLNILLQLYRQSR